MARKIYCYRGSENAADVCPERSKPEIEKRCNDDNCGANWFTGPWSEVIWTKKYIYLHAESFEFLTFLKKKKIYAFPKTYLFSLIVLRVSS